MVYQLGNFLDTDFKMMGVFRSEKAAMASRVRQMRSQKLDHFSIADIRGGREFGTYAVFATGSGFEVHHILHQQPEADLDDREYLSHRDPLAAGKTAKAAQILRSLGYSATVRSELNSLDDDDRFGRYPDDL